MILLEQLAFLQGQTVNVIFYIDDNILIYTFSQEYWPL
jgi:hypothetical protein